MSTKIQVNIRLTPEEHARLLKCASEAGLERGVARNAGNKTSALETIGQTETGNPGPRGPDTSLLT